METLMENTKVQKRRGPKRKFKSEIVRFSLHLPEPVHTAMTTMANDEYPPSSLTNLIQIAILQFLNRRGAKLPDKL
jgi:hypothetical protein